MRGQLGISTAVMEKISMQDNGGVEKGKFMSVTKIAIATTEPFNTK
jgi:hypothetical protein